MAISNYAPGTCDGNEFWIAIIKAGDRRVETSTKAPTPSATLGRSSAGCSPSRRSAPAMP